MNLQRGDAAAERLILITHGTDTMTEPAAALRRIADKVIAFTSLMLTARFCTSAALFDLGCTVGQCTPSHLQAIEATDPGVVINQFPICGPR